MTITLLLLIAVFVIGVTFLKKRQLNGLFDRQNKLVNALKTTKWFQNYWLSGGFLFAINAILFCLTGLFIYVLTFFLIPFVHLFVMAAAIIGSIYLWILFNHAWQGTNRGRLKMGAIGSSFYVILSTIFIYWFVTLEPQYPGEDTFMRALGLMFAIVVTTTAFTTCFVMTGFSKKITSVTL